MDLHERSTFRSTVLARKNTGLHLPARLVPLVGGVVARLPAVPSRWREHQRVERSLWDRDRADE